MYITDLLHLSKCVNNNSNYTCFMCVPPCQNNQLSTITHDVKLKTLVDLNYIDLI